MKEKEIEMYFDGGCRGNPSEYGAVGIVVYVDGELVFKGSYLVEEGMVAEQKRVTNNISEWSGLLRAFKKLDTMDLSGCDIKIHGDSKLVINQFNGEWKINDEILYAFSVVTSSYAENVKKDNKVEVLWIPREDNSLADREVNTFLDEY